MGHDCCMPDLLAYTTTVASRSHLVALPDPPRNIGVLGSASSSNTVSAPDASLLSEFELGERGAPTLESSPGGDERAKASGLLTMVMDDVTCV